MAEGNSSSTDLEPQQGFTTTGQSQPAPKSLKDIILWEPKIKHFAFRQLNSYLFCLKLYPKGKIKLAF